MPKKTDKESQKKVKKKKANNSHTLPTAILLTILGVAIFYPAKSISAPNNFVQVSKNSLSSSFLVSSATSSANPIVAEIEKKLFTTTTLGFDDTQLKNLGNTEKLEILNQRLINYKKRFDFKLQKLANRIAIAQKNQLPIDQTILDFKPIYDSPELMANFDKLSLYIQQLDSILYSKKIERPVIVSSNTKQIPILMYHRVEEFDKLPKFLKTPTRKDISLDPNDFYKQMDKIKAAGYQTVTMRQVGEATAKGDKEFFNGKKIVLTFDDGYTEHFKIVFPKLKELGFVGTFGVITSYQGTNGYIDWNMIREMSQNKMEIVSHSANHCPLGSLRGQDGSSLPLGGESKLCNAQKEGSLGSVRTGKLLPKNQIKTEILESRKRIFAETGTWTNHLIYPYGSYNEEVSDIALLSGYDTATIVGSGPLIDLENPMQIPRISMGTNFDWLK